MRLKLTARLPDGVRDLLLTVDSTATIGGIARRLWPEESGAMPTLRVWSAGEYAVQILDPELSVHESGLRSGYTVEATDQVPASLAKKLTAPGETFIRIPRVLAALETQEFKLPPQPDSPPPVKPSWIAGITPVLMGVGMFAVTKQPYSLLIVALSPVTVLGSWLDGTLKARKTRRKKYAEHRLELDALHKKVTEVHRREQQIRCEMTPSGSEIGAAIVGRSGLLWSRRPSDDLFLELRLGVASLPAKTTLLSLPPGPDDETAILARELNDIPDLPVTVNLRSVGSLGVGGITKAAIARGLLLQLAGLHSPADLSIAMHTSEASMNYWSWLKWIPHVDSVHSPLTVSLADSSTTRAQLLDGVETLINSRVRAHSAPSVAAATGAAAHYKQETEGALILIIDEYQDDDLARLVSIAESGPKVGVYTIWMCEREDRLPHVCRSHIISSRRELRVNSEKFLNIIAAAEPVSLRDAAYFARLLAPLEDLTASGVDESDLPNSVDIVDLWPGSCQTAHDIAELWRESDTLRGTWSGPRYPQKLNVPVGQCASGLFSLDLRSDGPHAFVAGTTGSGKSDFLQTWITSMATNYSPEHVTFLLIDFKGGASFGECTKLPHTVGVVSDLTPHLLRRALVSLRAELRRREQLLHEKNAKDLETLETRGDPDTPPLLVVVIDEFAALIDQVPDFIDGVTDLAQRGRSLGMHLILATQRPAGVIPEKLRANMNLRVSLRVSDPNESIDVIDVPRAAHIHPQIPGRAIARLGESRIIDFQTAYLGRRAITTEIGSQPEREPQINVAELPFGVGETWNESQRSEINYQPKPSAELHGLTLPTYGEQLIEAVLGASALTSIAQPRRPWLTPIPPLIDLKALLGSGRRAEDSPLEKILIGIVDEPAKQQQAWHDFIPDASHFLALGMGGTGRSTVLRTFAASVSLNTLRLPNETASTAPWSDEEMPAIYAVDSGSGPLASLQMLPTVGSVISPSDTERVTRLFRTLDQEIEERAQGSQLRSGGPRDRVEGLYEHQHNHSLADKRNRGRIFLLIDAFEAFRDKYERLEGGRNWDRLFRIVANGRTLGIHCIFTADRETSIPASLLTHFTQQIHLDERPQFEQYSRHSAISQTSNLDADRQRTPGRGRVQGIEHAGCEIQIARLGNDEDSDFSALTSALKNRFGYKSSWPDEIRQLPDNIELSTLKFHTFDAPVLGISDETLKPVTVPTNGLFVVTGGFGSGRTTAMRTLVTSTVRALAPEMILLAARSSQLRSTTIWSQCATSEREAARIIPSLAERISALNTPLQNRTPICIVVEGVADFAGLEIEGQLASLLRIARQSNVLVLAEADTLIAAQAWQLWAELKTARAGIVLQPEEGDGHALFRVAFPRTSRAEYPPGRGLMVMSGVVSRVQVAFTPNSDRSKPGRSDTAGLTREIETQLVEDSPALTLVM